MPARLALVPDPSGLSGCDSLVFVGRAARLVEDDVLRLIPPQVGEATWRQMVKKTDAGDQGRVATTWTSGTPSRVSAGVLPEPCSRHNAPSRAGSIPGLLASAAQKGNVGIVLCLAELDHAAASVLAVARALPTFSTGATPIERDARILVLAPEGGEVPVGPLGIAADAVRLAAHWTDTPPDVFGCDRFVQVAEEIARDTGARITVLRARELADQGLNGLHAVGRAAAQEPALVVLDHDPGGTERTVAWVGKGIVFDTGGLAIKAKTSMPGMKTDMAGAAAVLASFQAAVRLGFGDRLVAVLCIAENAVGPGALRPDDILTMASGRTVEVNNPDAEGRLVLADGVSWVVKHHSPDVVIDLATLTGAQAIATGKRHAAIVSSDEKLETDAVRAGLFSGDLVFPLPFVPELFRREFQSPVADMRNSVKDRNNAQSSCAAQFIHNHVTASGYDGPWLHVDMAAPAVHPNGRGTGFGVGLLLALAGALE